MTYITYITYMTYMTYITYIIYITYVTDSTYSTYRTYSTYIIDITYTLHDFTAHSDLWQLRAWEGEGNRGEKKAELFTFMLPEITSIYSSPCSPPSALQCGAESYLLCCQPEPSLRNYLPDYHELLHDSLADCTLKEDELST